MKRFLILSVLALSACGPSAGQVETAIAQTEAARPTATSTATPAPTETPVPTTDPCPYEDALLYSVKIEDQIQIFLELTRQYLNTSGETRQAVMKGMIVVQDSMKELSPPPCATEAHAAVLKYSQTSIEAMSAYDANSSNINEMLARLELDATAARSELDKFQAAAGIER